jgi:hypothetical protein
MGKLSLSGTAGTTRAAAVAVVFAVAALAGCTTPPDYVKPTATTATAGRAPETAPERAAQAPGASAAASARE